MAVRSIPKRRRVALTGWVAGICLLLPCGGAAWGQWEQTRKLTAGDAAEMDYFGKSVSISGDIVVVGSECDDDAGICSGSAYVFDATTGVQLHKLTAGDAAAYDYFGLRVSVSGNTIVVGAADDDDAGTNSGAVYVFDATTGVQLHKLTADDGAEFDWFGSFVSVSGNTIVIGAFGDDDAGSMSGSVYVFDATTGQQLHKLTADDAAEDDWFGFSGAISGDIIVVGSLNDDDAGGDSGSAYVFDATTGQQLHKLTAGDAEAGDRFGISVSVSGDTIVVGAYWDDDAGSKSGSAYLFNATTGQQLHKLTADDAATDDLFGWAVSVSGNSIVVGAPAPYDFDAGSWTGSAYVFDVNTGQQLCKLIADDAATDDRFGDSVSVSGDIIVVGASGNDDAGWDSGSAYVFQPSGPCPADVNGDGKVNIDDLFLVLGAWGVCDDCPEDLNDDGKVNIDDLFVILGDWGPCP